MGDRFKLKDQKSLFILFGVIFLISFIVFFPYIFLKRPFVFLNDQLFQYNLFYKEWIRLLNEFFQYGNLPFYSWNRFLGTDFYSSGAFVVTSDPFIFIIMLFDQVETGLMIETIALIFVSAFSFRYYLIKFGIKSELSLLVAPVLYAFSGIMTVYIGTYMFQRFYAFLPLLFAGVELYFSKRKMGVFVFSSALLFFMSYYFMFPTSFILVVYVALNYYRYYGLKNYKQFVILSLKLIGLYTLGFGISSFLTLPAILYVLGNSRVGSKETFGLFWDLKVYIGMFFNAFYGPFPQYTKYPYLFYSGYTGHASSYSLYTSSFSLLVIYDFLKRSKIKKKNFYIGLLVLLLLLLFFLPINTIFHGFSEPTLRLSLFYPIFALLIFSVHLENFKSMSFKKVLLFLGTVSMVFFSVLLIKYRIQMKDMVLTFSLLILAIFSALISSNLYIKNRKHFTIWIITEVVFMMFVSLWIYNVNFDPYQPSFTQEYVDYFATSDEDLFYRVYLNPYDLMPSSDLNMNQSLNYNYASVSTFDSLLEPSIKPFLDLNKEYWHIVHLTNSNVLKMLGVKYYWVEDEEDLPNFGTFKYVYNQDHLKVFIDENYRTLGYTYSNFKTIETTELFDKWLETLLIKEEDIDLIIDINENQASESFEITRIDGQRLSGNITLDDKQVLFLSIPYNKGWSITDNGEEIQYLNVQGGFIGLVLNEGDHNLEFYFVPHGLKFGVILSIISALLSTFIILRKRLPNS